MSKKRLILVTVLIILVLITVIFLISSLLKQSPDPYVPTTAKESGSTEKTVDNTPLEAAPVENVLEPLPSDNKTAIENEITNIDKEINSAIETELDDLSDIENSL